MPYLKIQTTKNVLNSKAKDLAQKASTMISKITGKPESYIQIALEGVDQMYFGGSDAPSAFVELKALGLPTGKTKELSQQICEFLERELGLEGKRIFIVFSPCEGNLWGWNGSTFA